MVAATPEPNPVSRPYADSALDWFDAGWAPLPLPANQKWPPPTGWTGEAGDEPNRVQIKKWIKSDGDGNVCIRLPGDVVGIDVDAYGEKTGNLTLAALEEIHGALPPTIRTTARGIDNPSGIRWFRIRPGTKFPGVLGEGIEVIQRHHRYAIVWPSINPKTNTVYTSYDDETGESLETFSPDDIEPLPESWYSVSAIDIGKGLDKSTELAPAEIAEWFADEANAGAQCRAIRNVATAEINALKAAALSGTSRYDTARDGVMALVRLAQEGHRGVGKALSGLHDVYDDVVSDEPNRDPGEWRRMVWGAVEAVAAEMEPAHAKGQCPDRVEPGAEPEDLWPPPSDPLRVAERLVSELWSSAEHDGAPTLASWRGDFYEWTGQFWQVCELAALEARVWRHLGGVEYGTVAGGVVGWSPNISKVSNVVRALATCAHRAARLDPDTGNEDVALIPFANGVLHLKRATGKYRLAEHTPAVFNLYRLPFDYDPDAPEPSEWLAFLASIELDDETIDLLQEWFGYVLSGDNSKSKIMYLFGATRAGKGVITRVLQQLVGEDNCSSPNLAAFGELFGLQSSIGKTLITVNDARFRGVKTAELVERLLNFTGSDSMDIPRKGLSSWQGRPSARVMIVSNDAPSLSGEQTTAFAKRMLGPIRMPVSFYDREDEGLERRLRAELPQILMWAFDGYDRLCGQSTGFTKPKSAQALHREIEESLSPVLAFVRERCVEGSSELVGKDVLYRAFVRWAEASNLYVYSKIEFGRQLRGVFDAVSETKTPSRGGAMQREHAWRGLSLIEREDVL